MLVLICGLENIIHYGMPLLIKVLASIINDNKSKVMGLKDNKKGAGSIEKQLSTDFADIDTHV
jgi:hypothetical protein